jgi:hypothetical protein
VEFGIVVIRTVSFNLRLFLGGATVCRGDIPPRLLPGNLTAAGKVSWAALACSPAGDFQAPLAAQNGLQIIYDSYLNQPVNR